MSLAANRASMAIEFIVKPKDDLFLEGTLRTLPRVSKGEAYPCQMQKNQTFSCLFRHYAKHKGLKKEDLVFFFVDELLPDQMPETVHLMPQDEIWVDHRTQPCSKISDVPKIISNFFDPKEFKVLLVRGTHSDVSLIVGEEKVEFKVHKAILSARSSYFSEMFQIGGMAENSSNKIVIDDINAEHSFQRMMEFIYTNEVSELQKCGSSEIIQLLEISIRYNLDDLRHLVEKAACIIINHENIGKFMLLCGTHSLMLLRDACKKFISVHGTQLRQDSLFRREIEHSPELGLLILDAMQEDESNKTISKSQKNKRRRVSENVSSSQHELVLVPNQAGDANTVLGIIQEQW